MVLDTRLPAHPASGEVEASEALIREARQRARRRRLRYAISAVVFVVAATGGGLAVRGGGDSPPPGASQAQHLAGGRDVKAPEQVDAVRPPGLAGVGAVWYDAEGLHHGGVVERTPVELVADHFEGVGSVFALVRHGAVYRDPATDDVWFHPWGGRPRVVGRGSVAGPGGDPESDVAAWFEGNELVVFDTARGEEISRTTEEAWTLEPGFLSEHVRDSNGFVHVSPAEVVWRSENVSGWQGMRRLDVETGTSSLVWDPYDPNSGPMPSDVHDTTRITPLLGDGQGDPPISLLIDVAGQEQLRLDPDSHGVEPGGRLSPDGSFVLAAMDPHSHAAIVDVRNRTIWKLPLTKSYVWTAWSYDNLAVVKVDRDDKTKSTLIACDAVTRECDRLPHRGRVLLPAS